MGNKKKQRETKKKNLVSLVFLRQINKKRDRETKKQDFPYKASLTRATRLRAYCVIFPFFFIIYIN